MMRSSVSNSTMYLCAFLALLAGCSSTAELTSSWANNHVEVDGKADEWGSSLKNLKDTRVFLGVKNDQEFVYICVTSLERQFGRQLIGAGLSVWFESENGNRFGILYPIGMRNQGGQPPVNIEEGQENEGRENVADQALLDLEILGPGKDDRNLFSTLQVPGVNVKVGRSGSSVAYELKVPLKKTGDHPYAVDAIPGSTLKMEIQTGKFDPGARVGRMGGGMRGGGRRPRGGEGMPGGEMPGGGEDRGLDMPRGNRPEPLDVSLNVHLARPESDVNHPR